MSVFLLCEFLEKFSRRRCSCVCFVAATGLEGNLSGVLRGVTSFYLSPIALTSPSRLVLCESLIIRRVALLVFRGGLRDLLAGETEKKTSHMAPES